METGHRGVGAKAAGLTVSQSCKYPTLPMTRYWERSRPPGNVSGNLQALQSSFMHRLSTMALLHDFPNRSPAPSQGPGPSLAANKPGNTGRAFHDSRP